MPLNLNEIDEVYLGLDQAIGYLQGVSQHTPQEYAPCSGCRALYAVVNARRVYLERGVFGNGPAKQRT